MAAASSRQSRPATTPPGSTISAFQGWISVAAVMPSLSARRMFTGLSSTRMSISKRRVDVYTDPCQGFDTVWGR